MKRVAELAVGKPEKGIIDDFLRAFQCENGVQPTRDSGFRRDRRIFRAFCEHANMSGTAAKPLPRAPPVGKGTEEQPTKKQKVPKDPEPDGFHGEIFLCNPRQHLQFVGPMRCTYYWVNHRVVKLN